MFRAFTRVEGHYTRLLRHYGDTAEGADWTSRETRERRFTILAEVGLARDAKVLDFGCGTGELLGFLRREQNYCGQYVGWDLSDPVLDAARAKFPEARFENREILSHGMPEDFDCILASGTFNVDYGHAELFLHQALPLLYRHTRHALAFNLLSTCAEARKSGLYYAEPETIFRFCRQHLSTQITLRHDYRIKPSLPPYDFTVYVYRQR